MTATTLALLAALACALLWAVFDALRKRLVGHVAPLPLTCILAIGQTPLYLAWAWLDGFAAPEAAYVGPGIAVWAVNMIANLLFFESLRRADLSASVPLLALTPVFAALMAASWLDEVLSAKEIAGVLLVVGGAIGMHGVRTLLKANVDGDGSTTRNARVGALLMAVVAALWAATAAFDKLSMQHSTIAMHAFLQAAALAVSLVVWLLVVGRLRELRDVTAVQGSFVAGVIVAAVALGLQLFAVMGAYVGVVEAIKRAVGAIAALLLGRIFFAETIGRRRVLAVLAMAIGVWLVAA